MQNKKVFPFFVVARSAGRGLTWLASLSWLESASRLTISWFRQPACQLKSLSRLTVPTDWCLVVKSRRLTALGIPVWRLFTNKMCLVFLPLIAVYW